MVTHVSVAILQNENGEFLLASRPPNKPWAGWWEFPGGKLEEGESAENALIRELQEELGVTPTHIQPWLARTFDYPEHSQNGHDSAAKTVKLHFFFVTKWQGELLGLENQQLNWQNANNISVLPILPANVPILKALALPPVYAISNVAELGEIAFFAALKTQLQQGLKLIQVREKQLENPALMRLTRQVIELAKPFNAKVLLNNNVTLAKALGADGVHLTSQQLMHLTQKPSDLPSNFMVAASCHNANELTLAQQLDLDFVVLSPINVTQSHADAVALGWQKFAELIENIELPIYALGGMAIDDLPQALSCGARGIASQRAIWC